jgi:hypothetical protein
MWWLYFRHDSEVVGFALIDAQTLHHARMQAVALGIGRVEDYGGGNEVDPKEATLVPKDCMGRLLSPEEAVGLLDRIERQSASRHHWPPLCTL